jgi:hypothetical protein
LTAALSSCDRNSTGNSDVSQVEGEFAEGREIIIDDEEEYIYPQGTLSVHVGELDENGQIEVITLYENNPGISAFNLELDFDETVFEPIYAQGLEFEGVSLNVGQSGNFSGLDKVTAAWSSENNKDVNEIESMFLVRFQLKQGAPTDKIQFTLYYNDSNGITNSKSESIKPQIVNYYL